MKFQYLVSAVSAAVFLSGCATPPANYAVNNTRSYSQSYDKVWENIVGYLAQNQIQVKNIAKDSGVIYAESVKFDNSVADCGTAGMEKILGRRALFNIFVNRSGKDPVVSVNTEFNEIRMVHGVSTPVPCNSKGIIEGNILSAAAQ
jgi:hypothetical protein